MAMNILVVVLAVIVIKFQSSKVLSFHNRSSLHFAYTLTTIFFTVVPCRIIKLSPN